jgi:predicted ribosomally synthesized peptide with SipW-like signal peptide
VIPKTGVKYRVKNMDKYVLASMMTIGVVAAMMIAGTFAFFSDIETASGNTMTAGVLNLFVNDADPYSGTLVEVELKPEYTAYSSVIDVKINDNPGKIYKRISNLNCNEQNIGNDLASKTWFDLEVNDAQLIPGQTLTVRDVEGKWIYLGVFGPEITIPVIQSFELQECLFEWSEEEGCTFDEEFRVEQINAPSPENCYNPTGGDCPNGVEAP